MKIALIIKDLTISGGTQRQFVELASYLHQNGHKVVVYSAKFAPANCYPEKTKNLEIRSLSLSKQKPFQIKARGLRGLTYMTNSILDLSRRLKKSRQMAKLIDKDIDLINTHDNELNELLAILRYDFNVPFVWQCNDLPTSFAVGVNSPTFGSLLQRTKARISNLPYKLLHVPIERYWAKHVDQITVNVEKNRKLIQQCYHRDAIVLRCGVDVGSFRPLINKPQNKKITILTGGVFYRYRRFEDIILAADLLRKHYPVEVKIFGSDTFDKSYSAELRKLVNKKRLQDTIIFMGGLSEEQLIYTFQTSDIFVWANHNQSWGNVVFESMACGVPVIVSKTAGASEVLTDKQNALIVEPLRPDILAKAIEELLNNNELRKKLITEGIKLVKNMQWDDYSAGMMRLFEDLIERKNGEYSH